MVNAQTDRGQRSLTVLAFCAPWCAHCLYQRKAFDVACAALPPEVGRRWVDIEADPGAVEAYGVEAIPMILALRDGMECLRLVGVQSGEMIVEGVRASEARGAAMTGCGGRKACPTARR